jgi:hypothetical protein
MTLPFGQGWCPFYLIQVDLVDFEEFEQLLTHGDNANLPSKFCFCDYWFKKYLRLHSSFALEQHEDSLFLLIIENIVVNYIN